jgi:hypothetical protein
VLAELRSWKLVADAPLVGWSFVAGTPLLLGLLLLWVSRFATLVSEAGIGRRGATGTRWIPWPQVQDVVIERNGVPLANKNTPRLVVAVYDNSGRRRVCPLLNDNNLDGMGRILAHDVAAIRATWERRRGADWSPEDSVTARVERRHRHPVPPAAIGGMTALMTLPVAFLALMLLMINGVDLSGGTVLLVVFGLPVVLFTAITAIAAVRQR